MGRNMFAPVRGAWKEPWGGRWGAGGPCRAPVFVLTHYPHEAIEMPQGTTFHFVTEDFGTAREQVRAAASELHVEIAGGASTVRQALAAGAIDELMLDVAPALLGAGARLFDASDACSGGRARE
jgi:dihydrofolate reductase